MSLELDLFEEFDIITEFQYPDYIYSTDSVEEKIAFSNYISSLSGYRILLLNGGIFDLFFVVAGLKDFHIETILNAGKHEIKNRIITNLSDPDFLKQVSDFAAELDKRGRTTENSTRLKNILQYLRDSKYII